MLGEDDDGAALSSDIPDDASVVLVAFGGLGLNVGMPPFEFFGVAKGLPGGRVFVRDPSQHFYQRPLEGLGATIPDIAAALRRLVGDRRVAVVGNSAGGYAALVVGSLMGADVVHAFVPLTFLDRRRRLLYHDKRWPQHIDPVNRGPDAQRAFLDAVPHVRRATATEFHVHYPNRLRIDRMHARRLRRLPNVELHGYDGDDHFVIRMLRDRGELRPLLERALGT